jgi:quercetin dioxygenase-like cupin family protein
MRRPIPDWKETSMIAASFNHRRLALAGLVFLGLSGFAAMAQAGECPADQVVANGKGQQAGGSIPLGVTDTVLGKIDLASLVTGLEGRELRLRQLVVEPGGTVPWHSHDDRPAIIYVLAGTITEFRSTCAVPIEHKAGDVVAETRGTSHWWKNQGQQTVKLTSSDLFHPMDPADAHMM